jgi:hypothetical protein
LNYLDISIENYTINSPSTYTRNQPPLV